MCVANNEWAKVSCGYAHTLIQKSDGSLYACGWNVFGQIGDGSTITRFEPVQITGEVIAGSKNSSPVVPKLTDMSIRTAVQNILFPEQKAVSNTPPPPVPLDLFEQADSTPPVIQEVPLVQPNTLTP